MKNLNRLEGLYLFSDLPGLRECHGQIKDGFPVKFMSLEAFQVEMPSLEDTEVILVEALSDDAERNLQYFQMILEKVKPIPIVFLTKKKTVREAVELVQQGALDYLNPFEDWARLKKFLEELLMRESLIPNSEFCGTSAEDVEQPFVVGKSVEMKKVVGMVDRVAALPTSVLLFGESGTGKEMLARYIHQQSHLCKKPFVVVNLPSIPPSLVESVLFGHEKGAFTNAFRRHYGKFELANGGTLFLDEIGDLQFDLQSKLLRVVQEGEIDRIGGVHPIKIDVRLIAATKVDLKKAVKRGLFRDDLFYRLNVVPVHLPPLRKRMVDLPELCQSFIQKYGKRFNKKAKAIDAPAMATLSKYHWPGNIRELENLIARMFALVDPNKTLLQIEDIPMEYGLSHISEKTPSNLNLDQAMDRYERDLVIRALQRCNWNRKKTAVALGVSYGILKYKLKKLKIILPGSGDRIEQSTQ